MINTYQKAMDWLLSINLFNGMKLSLSNSLLLDKLQNYPSQSFPSIHIAGTNGKGSVTKKIASALQHDGKKVGLYTSPHISCFRERICINGEMIPEERVTAILNDLHAIITRHKIDCTFFEITTILAFTYFRQNQVDIAVVETGLGGRYDATNIAASTLSVITSISLDHTEVLGNTVEAIAQEKAGIIKTGFPVVLGPRLPHKLFEAAAKRHGSPCIKVEGTFPNFEEENCAIAKTALRHLQVSEKAIQKGLIASLPCRMQILKGPIPILLDVAHNPDGLTALFKAINTGFPGKNIRIVFGLSKNKDIASCLRIIQQHGQAFHLVESCNGRGVPVKQLREGLLTLGINEDGIFIGDTIHDSIQRARVEAEKNDQLLVVCGTFFIMGEARASLGIVEPRDSVDMNERSTTCFLLENKT